MYLTEISSRSVLRASAHGDFCAFCRSTASVESATDRVETVSIDSTVQVQG